MTKFGSSFMMKSPLYEHGEKLRKEAMRLSKESSGRDDSPDYDNPKVVKLLDQAKKADKSHGSDSPAKMKSPLHAPVTETQGITSDMYYKPRDEMDYSKMSEAAKALGKASNTAVTGGMGDKKKIDAIDDHGDKAQKKILDLKTKNQNSKTLQDNSQMKWVSGQDEKPGEFMRVDKNNNFYSVKPGDN